MKLHGLIFSHSIFTVSRCQFPVPIPFSHVKIDAWLLRGAKSSLITELRGPLNNNCSIMACVKLAQTCHRLIIDDRVTIAND